MPAALDVPLQQSPQFARALKAFGADVASTGPVILRRSFGPLGSIAFASRATPEAVASTPVHILNGETPCPQAYRAAGFRQIITPAHIAEWDLQTADIRAALHGKWRNRLVKGEAQSLTLRERVWDGRPHDLFARSNELARKRGFSNYPARLLAAFAQENPSDAIIFEAYQNTDLIAACLVLRHGATATYQTAWANPTGYALHAPRVILWQAACRMASLGHKTFDLGVLETDRSAGLARFKLGTGAQIRQLGGTWVRLRSGR
ncbi:MAG: GNAT family N-acetyltransferase [Octadecabacter sp.]|nr:GNAT family N-acetyltransferase [Octadecabacter sp.]